MERRGEIEETAGSFYSEQFRRSCEKTVHFCEEHSKEVVGSFLTAFKNALERGKELQDSGKKSKVQYLVFSHLYSSMFLRKYLIRIEILDGGFYNDTTQAVSYWDAGSIYRFLEDDIEEIKQKTGKTVLRLWEYETDFIRYAYMPFYHRIAKAFIQEMMKEILSDGSILPEVERREEQVKILFGEYMGEADLLFTLGLEHMENEEKDK